MQNIFGTDVCIKFKIEEISITGDYSRKTDYAFALLRV